jgi:hypothetical protein
VLVGAGLNYALLDRVVDAAYWAYRERFLREKTGDFTFHDLSNGSPSGDDADPDGVVEVPIDVITIVDEAIAEAMAEKDAIEGPEVEESVPNV